MTFRTHLAEIAYSMLGNLKMLFLLYPMDRQSKVLFYGNSLMLAGVQATFKGYAGFEVLALDKPATKRELLAFGPSVVVFDMGALESEFLCAQMQELTRVLVIGVDPESHEQIVCELIAPRVAHPAPQPPKARSSSIPSG